MGQGESREGQETEIDQDAQDGQDKNTFKVYVLI